MHIVFTDLDDELEDDEEEELELDDEEELQMCKLYSMYPKSGVYGYICGVYAVCARVFHCMCVRMYAGKYIIQCVCMRAKECVGLCGSK